MKMLNCCCFKDKISCLNYITVGSAAAVIGGEGRKPHDAKNVENIFNFVCCRQAGKTVSDNMKKMFLAFEGCCQLKVFYLQK